MYSVIASFDWKKGFRPPSPSSYGQSQNEAPISADISSIFEDMDNIVDICDKYDGKRPIEFRLSYNVNTKAFDAKYNYDDFAGDGDVDLVDIFEDWQKECEAELNS